MAGAQAALDDEAAAFVASRKALADLAADIRATTAATGGSGGGAAQLAAAFPSLRARLGGAFASAAALPAPRVAAAAVILDLAPVERVAAAAPSLGDLELVEVRVAHGGEEGGMVDHATVPPTPPPSPPPSPPPPPDARR